MATTAYPGRDGLLQISANGGSTFTTIGGVRNVQVTVNNNPVDITNVLSDGFQEMLANGGIQSVAISCDGVVADDTAWQTMVTQAHDRTSIHYKFTFASGGIIAGQMVFTTFQYTGAIADAQTFTGQLASNGTIAFTEPT